MNSRNSDAAAPAHTDEPSAKKAATVGGRDDMPYARHTRDVEPADNIDNTPTLARKIAFNASLLSQPAILPWRFPFPSMYTVVGQGEVHRLLAKSRSPTVSAAQPPRQK